MLQNPYYSNPLLKHGLDEWDGLGFKETPYLRADSRLFKFML